MIELEVSNTPNGTIDFTPKSLRWVVERTFAWLDGFRRLTRNDEQTNESAEEMIDFATVKFLINHIFNNYKNIKSKHTLNLHMS